MSPYQGQLKYNIAISKFVVRVCRFIGSKYNIVNLSMSIVTTCKLIAK